MCILIYFIIFFLKFFQAFLWILNNFQFIDTFVKISIDIIFNISVRFKYQYIYIYWYFHPWVCIDFIHIYIYISKWEIVLVMLRSGEKCTHNLCMFIYMRVWVKNNPIGQTNMHFDPHLKLLFKMTSFSFILYLLLNKKNWNYILKMWFQYKFKITFRK